MSTVQSPSRRFRWPEAAMRRVVLLGAVAGWFLSGVNVIRSHVPTTQIDGSERGDPSRVPWLEPRDARQMNKQGRPEPTDAATASPSTNAVNTTAIVASPHTLVRLPRVLALYFPQFHRDPLNDRLWGDGFTDWDSLRAAPRANRLGFALPRPLPEAPGEGFGGGGLGYYDLRNVTVRRRQADLARRHGVDGFVYHHYWFYNNDDNVGDDEAARGGDPPLSAPLRELLRDGQPDLPFCLHWANTGWSRQWNRDTTNGTAATGAWLMEQRFPRPPATRHTSVNGSEGRGDGGEDDEDWVAEVKRHYAWLRPFFHHPNYIRVGGAPVLMVYMWFRESVPALQTLRRLAVLDGFPGLYLTMGLSMTHDALFPPGRRLGQRRWRPAFDGLVNATVAYPYPLGQLQGRTLRVPDWCRRGERGEKDVPAVTGGAPVVPGVVVAFDNTPRRPFDTAVIWSADAPERVRCRFRDSVTAAMYHEACCRLGGGGAPTGTEEGGAVAPHRGAGSSASERVDDDRFILVNAWNEWAEGMALEPSTVFGYGLLEAVAAAKAQVRASQCRWPLPAVDEDEIHKT